MISLILLPGASRLQESYLSACPLFWLAYLVQPFVSLMAMWVLSSTQFSLYFIQFLCWIPSNLNAYQLLPDLHLYIVYCSNLSHWTSQGPLDPSTWIFQNLLKLKICKTCQVTLPVKPALLAVVLIVVIKWVAPTQGMMKSTIDTTRMFYITFS